MSVSKLTVIRIFLSVLRLLELILAFLYACDDILYPIYTFLADNEEFATNPYILPFIKLLGFLIRKLYRPTMFFHNLYVSIFEYLADNYKVLFKYCDAVDAFLNKYGEIIVLMVSPIVFSSLILIFC